MRSIVLILILFTINFSLAQVHIGDTNGHSDVSAILEVESNMKGMLIPRLSDMERDAIQNPALGLFIFNTSSKEFNYYDGSSWHSLSPKELLEHDCGDAYDNDQDGFLDCLDFDCESSCNCVECDCSDGIDNDDNGFIDCADFYCSDGSVFECNCIDGADNDGDGLTDCEDPDCGFSQDIECNCGDGIDNDNDTFFDCDDFDCIGNPLCP